MKKKLNDHIYLYDAAKSEWVGRAPSTFKAPYEKPKPPLEIQLAEAKIDIKILENAVGLLESLLRGALKRV